MSEATMRAAISIIQPDSFKAEVASAADEGALGASVNNPATRPVQDGAAAVPIGVPEASPIALLALEDVALEPRFVARIPNAQAHGDYLEAAHESTYRTLAVIHLMLAKGDTDGASDLLKRLRDHLDALWSERKEAAALGVRP